MNSLTGCLKILPPDELENLDLPMNEESSSPVKKVVYLSGNDLPYAGGNSTLSQQPIEGTRFNLFTGIQTFDQREESFKVRTHLIVFSIVVIIGDCHHLNAYLSLSFSLLIIT